MSVLRLDYVRRCDFCGVTEHEAGYLVESPDFKSHICDECVTACMELIANASVEVNPRKEVRR